MPPRPEPSQPISPRLKLLLDFGPLLAFFLVNRTHGIFVATAVIMVLITISLVVSWRLEGRLPMVPLVGAVIVLVMGGATLWLNDEGFIKLKPTLLYGLFALVLLGGQLAGRPLLKPLLGSTLPMTDAGWRALSWRWVGFFLGMAVLNEVLRRALTTDQWVTFKVFGAMALTFGFMLAQLPLIQRHALAPPPTTTADADAEPPS
jgi:intracellular septation protein